MEKQVWHIINNEDGFVLGAAILVSAILILAGVLALWTSTTEVQVVRNEGMMTREFYDAEAGLIDALENYGAGTTEWLTNEFLLKEPSNANNIVISRDPDGQPVAAIEARCIIEDYQDEDEPNQVLSEAANRLPSQSHITPPPADSGYSLKYFEIRRYGITATSADGNTQIQVGVWKVFNKY